MKSMMNIDNVVQVVDENLIKSSPRKTTMVNARVSGRQYHKICFQNIVFFFLSFY